MLNHKEEKLQINYTRKKASGSVRMVGFKDNGFQMLYIPSFGISSYGETIEEAKQMMTETLDDFFNGLVSLPEKQFLEELDKMGWKRSVFFKKKFENIAPYVDRDGILNNFNLPQNTEIKEEVLSI